MNNSQALPHNQIGQTTTKEDETDKSNIEAF